MSPQKRDARARQQKQKEELELEAAYAASARGMSGIHDDVSQIRRERLFQDPGDFFVYPPH